MPNPMIHDYKDEAVAGLASIDAGNPATDPANVTQYDPKALIPNGDTRDAAMVHKAFCGDMSLFAGKGKGIQATPEYKRK